jgi:predicted transcriptional regulator
MTTTVRISEDTRDKLRALSERSGESMQDVLDQAVEQYRRSRFFAEVDLAYAALRADPAVWADELAERETLDGAVADDLDER